ncbi:MAG: hypothetical protein PHI32_04240 [Dysgonamonadaceae bacterium]|nr:hypothetical protein [Dysgonamonadaceae bacterium]MDD4728781.1 hypothetical protein [Dysgonamonadaceae bacterium]
MKYIKIMIFLMLVFTSCLLICCSTNNQKVLEEEIVENVKENEKDSVVDDADTPSNQVMTLGTYAGLPRQSDGRTDIITLINQLNDLNANTYNWLIWKGDKDWDDLILFLPWAKQHNISVWVTLVPPSESKPRYKWNSEPYGKDYIRWAKEIARLSKVYPNLVALSIDDFILSNLDTFTPEYLGEMIKEFDKVNSNLSFIPCVYYDQVTPDFVNKYSFLIDGILLPYRSESNVMNLQNPDLVQSEVTHIKSLFKEEMPIYIDVYSSAHSKLGASTPAYVEKVIKNGGKYGDGILIYVHPNPSTESEKYKIIKDEFARLSNLKK